jgi:Flp pilus assembly protein TadD
VAKVPGSSLAWNNLGAARRDSGDLPGAARGFRRALELDPSNRTARFNLLAMEFTTPDATRKGREP